MVPLGNGQALLASQGGIGAEVWVQDGVLFSIDGPTITPDQVQALSTQVYASAAR